MKKFFTISKKSSGTLKTQVSNHKNYFKSYMIILLDTKIHLTKLSTYDLKKTQQF